MNEGTLAAPEPRPMIDVVLLDKDGTVVETRSMTSSAALPAWIEHPNRQGYHEWVAAYPRRAEPDYTGDPYEPLPRFELTDADARPAVYTRVAPNGAARA